MASCKSCGHDASLAQRFCKRCGAEVHVEIAEPVGQTCSNCGRSASPEQLFCKFDGTPLRAQSLGSSSANQDPPSMSFLRNAWAKFEVFWNSYGLLVNTTAVLALPAILIAPDPDAATVSFILLLPVVTAWIVALFDWPFLEKLVNAADTRFQRAYRRDLSDAGRIRRWVIRPIIAMQARWITFAERAPSEQVFAGMRWFGYVVSGLLAVIIIGMLIYAAVVAIIFVVVMVLSLIAIGLILAMLTGDAPGGSRGGRGSLGGLDPLMGAGRRGRELFRDRGGIFEAAERTGRIDKEGRIYSGSGGFFASDEQIGQVDSDGRIYETKGGFFDSKNQVGRIDDDGTVHEGGGGFFDREDRVGKVDDDGRIHRGGGGIFEADQQVGKTK